MAKSNVTPKAMPTCHPIGDRFIYKGRMIEAVEDYPTESDLRCTGCVFLRDPYCGNASLIAGECWGSRRPDGKNVKFVKAKPINR